MPDLDFSSEQLWLNPGRQPDDVFPLPDEHRSAVAEASERMRRFAPLLANLFPELRQTAGIIESPLIDGYPLAASLGAGDRTGALLIKGDHLLPVVGSIKARGGFHAVLAHAEEIATREGLISRFGHAGLSTPDARAFFEQRTLAVGSTGNLGLSVGTMASALGFRTVVHMSSEAKGWKKQRLLGLGVSVIEHQGDYESALAAGRAEAAADPNAFFIDDEDSLPLLHGYATAIEPLKGQLAAEGVKVDHDHPLLVYVPCGVGGAPAGIALGLRLAFGPAAYVFFAEPVQSPCVLAAMGTPDQLEFPSIYDLGLSGVTEADGLAVPRASRCAVDVARPLISGIFTVKDTTMFAHMAAAHQRLQIRLEPSAAAGFSGLLHLQNNEVLQQMGFGDRLARGSHLVWATGGNLIPDELFNQMIGRMA